MASIVNLAEDPFQGLVSLGGLLPRPSITNFRDWREFVEAPPAVRPPQLAKAVYQGMGSADRARYNEQRKRYHAAFGPIETPKLKNVHAEVLRLAALNYRSAPGARPGAVVDGLGTVGKTTITMHMGRKYELTVRKHFGFVGEELPNGNLFVPVVYVSLPGSLTIKAFNWLVVDYFNIPAPRNASEDWLTRQIVSIAKACGTSLFIVDDIHFVKMKNRSGETINNHFKSLANSISATFVYAGIDLEGTKLLAEGASKGRAVYSQTRHRFKRYEICPFKKDDPEFLSLLATFEQHLLLMDHEPGTLVGKLAGYIHDRTDGFIGAISDLLREGANLAIDRDEEKLTPRLLNRVTLDHAAEEHRAAVTGGRTGR